MASIVRTGVCARVAAEQGTIIPGSGPVLGKLSKWKRRRGVREVWNNREWSVRCFRALQLNAAMSWQRDKPLEAVFAWWQLRGAFEQWRLTHGVDPRILPRRSPTEYAFDRYDCPPAEPRKMLVHLRVAQDGGCVPSRVGLL